MKKEKNINFSFFGLDLLSESEMQKTNGGLWNGGLGHRGPSLTPAQAKLILHEFGDFFRGFWDGL